MKWSGGDATKEAAGAAAFSADPTAKTANLVLCQVYFHGSADAPAGYLVVGTIPFSSLAPIRATGKLVLVLLDTDC